MSEFIIFICIFIAVLALVLALKKIRKERYTYDERQITAQNKAYKAAFATTVLYFAFNTVYYIAMGDIWADPAVLCFTGIAAGITVFISVCIFSDAYFPINTGAKRFAVTFGILTAINVAGIIDNAADKQSFIENGMLNLNCLNIIVTAVFVVFFVSVLIKTLMDKKGAKNEKP